MKYQKFGLLIIITLAAVLLFACDNPFWPEKTVKPEQEPEIPEVITDCGHNNYGEWLVTTHATCLTNGARERDCVACGHIQTEVITDASAHNWLQSDGTPSTCTETGAGTRECTLCYEEEISDVLEIDPSNHNWGAFTQTTLPTCSEPGIMTKDCTRCGTRNDTESQEGEPKLSETGIHVLAGTLTVTVPATCLKAGANGRRCTFSTCWFFTTNGGIVNPLGHLNSTWIDNTATCTETGFETLKCNRDPCVDPQTRDTQALGHTLTAWLKDSETTCLEEKRTCTRVVPVQCTHFEGQTLPVTTHNWNGLWSRSGKLIKTCITKCKDNNDCTATRSLDEEMVQIQGGRMPLATDTTYRNWGTHTITLSAFKMHKFQVTQDLYVAVMGTNPSNFKTGVTSGERQEQRPVETVTWYDAVEFCIKLSEREGFTSYAMNNRTPATGYPITNATVTWIDDQYFNGYRLPTEAEWEYACRAGTRTAYYFGDASSELVNYAWYGTGGGDANSKTHQVGLKLPNQWGLYDMLGNVREFCWDWYQEQIPLATAAATNPKGPVSGTDRVQRGGYYSHNFNINRTEYRLYFEPGRAASNQNGFRIVLNQPQQQ